MPARACLCLCVCLACVATVLPSAPPPQVCLSSSQRDVTALRAAGLGAADTLLQHGSALQLMKVRSGGPRRARGRRDTSAPLHAEVP